MKRTAQTLHLLAGVVVALVFCASVHADDVFTTKSYEDAKADARDAGKLLVLDFTAVWCKPCQMMLQTTWKDDAVVGWVERNAIAVKIDTDKNKDIVQQYQVGPIPTIVMVRGDQELGRIVGYKDAEPFAKWLDDAANGRVEELKVPPRPQPGEKADMQARLSLARDLINQRKLDDATDEFVWLWNHMLEHQPSMHGVRLSFMASDMKRLAEAHAPAKKAFTELRDALTPAVNGENPQREQVADWMELCKIVGDDAVVMDWFPKALDNRIARSLLERSWHELFAIFAQNNRAGELIKLFPDPMAEADRQIKRLDHMAEQIARADFPEDRRKEMQEPLSRLRNSNLARLYAVCLAADRDDDATNIAEMLLKIEGNESAGVELAHAALIANEPREIQLKWLEAAPNDEMGMKSEVQKMLKRALERRSISG